MTGAVRLEPAHARVAGALHALSFAAPWSDAEFASLLAQPGVAGLLWNAAEPQGFILIRAVADEAEILTLAVAPAYRRRGVAALLLDEATRLLRAGGTHRLFLEVAADNAAAIGLYEKAGFSATGRRTGYYARAGAASMDAVIMTLELMMPSRSAAPHH